MTGRERKILMPSTSRKQTNFISNTIATTSNNSNIICQQIAGLYDLEETLGKGHFAIVKAAKHVFTGERVAVKVIDKTKLDKMSQKALLQEVICMKLVQHTNIIRLYEVIDTSSKMYLVLELGHGDLYDLILKQQGGLGEDISRRYFSQIVSAVSYCHRLHVVHRDLKPENIVYFPNSNGGQVKLTDFGFSNKFHPGIKLDTSCGSLAYSAPEILLGDSYDAPAVDIWSMGIILYMLVCGRVPFQEANDSETLTMIMDVKYSIPQHITIPCQHLISCMLIRYPEKRSTLDEIQNNIWLNQDCLEKHIENSRITDYHLTVDEKNTIIQQMINGQIGTREEILEAVDKNAYNHITSTFYLLAEKYIKEHGIDMIGIELQPSGINSTLTSSLESLHDRRKNSSGHSGPSDTDEFGSGCEEDILGPLDLEMKNASIATVQAVKKTFRLHTTHSSSALSDMDKTNTLPILEEDVQAGYYYYNEMDDNNSLLINKQKLQTYHLHHQQQQQQQQQQQRCSSSSSSNSRQPIYNQQRRRHVILPQRSTSCSSSEDEDSEKRRMMKKIDCSGGGGVGCISGGIGLKYKKLIRSDDDENCRFDEIKKFFDDESSDEHIGSTVAIVTEEEVVNSSRFIGVDENDEQQQQQQQQQQEDEEEKIKEVNEIDEYNKNKKQFCQVKIIPSVVVVKGDDDDVVDGGGESHVKRYLTLSKSNDYLNDEKNGKYDDNILNDFKTTNNIIQHNDTINISEKEQQQQQQSSSITTNSFNLAKKGKKLFFNWFFFKKGQTITTTSCNIKKNNDLLCSSSSSSSSSCNNIIPGSSRIYKTKSCSELKMKNINSKQQVPNGSRDVNQNL